MRSPADMDIFQIDIGNRCFLKCSNCTRGIAHISSATRFDMDVNTFARALRSMEGWERLGPNRVLGMIAGEPTLHPDFEELAITFAHQWGGPYCEHGRDPILDFNAFAEERLFDRSNGRGLWTSFGAGFYRHMETILRVFSHWNPNDHTASGRHQALFVGRRDYCEATGMSDEEWERNRDRCWVQNQWSGTINDKGAYPCEVMATIDRLYYDGSHAWPVEPGWWQRKPEDFGDMLDLCNHCALAQPGPSTVDSVERDIISPSELKLLEQAGSPAVRKGQFDLYGPDFTERRTVTTKDSYVAGCRVSPLNRSMKPQRVACVVVCVGMADRLRETLGHNAGLVDEIVVVTHPQDSETAAVAYQHSTLALSPRCYDDGHAFNKGRMINDGLAALTRPDWIILTDADVFLNHNLRRYLHAHALNPGVLYGTRRLDCPPELAPAVREHGTWLAGLDQQHAHLSNEPNGYFQLFNRRATVIRDRWPHVMSEEFCSAGGVDSWFMQQFGPEIRRIIPEIPVVHIMHGELGSQWNNGRPGWRQYGMITPNGTVTLEEPPPGPRRLRLTDTLHGHAVECETPIPPDVLRRTEHGLIFCGRDIGWHHIHAAYWKEAT